MGIYVDPGHTAFEMSRFSEIYIDKSMLIAKVNAAYKTEKRFLCVSRPRRFGKSMAANMLSAYYSCGCDSAALFSGKIFLAGKSAITSISKYLSLFTCVITISDISVVDSQF